MAAQPRPARSDGADLMFRPGDIIDIWVIEAALGSGGMGSVYRCHNRAATRILAAVKVLDGDLKRYPEAEARFIREADILGRLDHPNIVKVRNVRPDADPPYIEMEFVAGQSLDERLRRGPLPYTEAIPLIRQCTDALAYLHRMGIRHRDIKPANLIVHDDQTKIVDFGLAVETDASRLTQHGVAFGTVSYAPPEWITPETLDPVLWDIYALGVVFYEVLTGEVAFPVSGQGTARQQAMQVIIAKQGHAPLDPGSAYHDDVRSLIADMTRCDARERASDAEDLARRARALDPTVRRTTGVTLAPPPGRNPFEFTSPTSDLLTSSSPVLRSVGQSPALSTSPPLDPPKRFGRLALAAGGAGLALGVLGFGILSLGGLAAIAWMGGMSELGGQGAARETVVEVVSALPPDQVDVVLSEGHRLRAEGASLVFGGVPASEVRVSWAAGAGCTVAGCASGECPPWCATGEERIPAGAARHQLSIGVGPREVEIPLSGIPADAKVVGALGEAAGERTGAGLAFSVLPGRYPLWVGVGDCAEAQRGCNDACPVGCSGASVEVTVPIEGQVTHDPLNITLPKAAEPRPAAPRPSRSNPPVITNAKLARFLETKPQWRPNGSFVVDQGNARDPNYLPGWSDDGQPPAGAEGSPPDGVPPLLAEAFCKGHGGLLPVDAEPNPPPYPELRLNTDGKMYYVEDTQNGGLQITPRWDDFDNKPIKKIRFRCAQ